MIAILCGKVCESPGWAAPPAVCNKEPNVRIGVLLWSWLAWSGRCSPGLELARPPAAEADIVAGRRSLRPGSNDGRLRARAGGGDLPSGWRIRPAQPSSTPSRIALSNRQSTQGTSWADERR